MRSTWTSVFVLLAAAFQDIFLSVMTPKNRRAEVSFNLVDFLFFKHSHYQEEIYLSSLAFYGRECIWTTRIATESVSIVEGVYGSPPFLTIGFEF
jgi:hypothetical protein